MWERFVLFCVKNRTSVFTYFQNAFGLNSYCSLSFNFSEQNIELSCFSMSIFASYMHARRSFLLYYTVIFAILSIIQYSYCSNKCRVLISPRNTLHFFSFARREMLNNLTLIVLGWVSVTSSRDEKNGSLSVKRSRFLLRTAACYASFWPHCNCLAACNSYSGNIKG